LSYILKGCGKCNGTINRVPGDEAHCVNCGKRYPSLDLPAVKK
jgi:hypothetical protein